MNRDTFGNTIHITTNIPTHTNEDPTPVVRPETEIIPLVQPEDFDPNSATVQQGRTREQLAELGRQGKIIEL